MTFYALDLTSCISLGRLTYSGGSVHLTQNLRISRWFFVSFLISVQISQCLAALQRDLWLKLVARSLFYRQLKWIFHFELFLRFFEGGRGRINVYAAWSLTRIHFCPFSGALKIHAMGVEGGSSSDRQLGSESSLG